MKKRALAWVGTGVAACECEGVAGRKARVEAEGTALMRSWSAAVELEEVNASIFFDFALRVLCRGDFVWVFLPLSWAIEISGDAMKFSARGACSLRLRFGCVGSRLRSLAGFLRLKSAIQEEFIGFQSWGDGLILVHVLIRVGDVDPLSDCLGKIAVPKIGMQFPSSAECPGCGARCGTVFSSSSISVSEMSPNRTCHSETRALIISA